ncbi:hypothetical protein NCC78_11500 [Micromonospora phytophila]|uniref:hypothetical protein n=1 Tax=Micromonospora phytophila TaxID=709888 RepID=UPI00202E1508|nr:hypothetical protein [Micromonospora phytophila]MCM0675307.1 hypothetical protein [Micromonospora phytophila]
MAGQRPGARQGPGMPRWVKVLALVAFALVLLFVIVQLTGFGGGHGPGRHLSQDGPGQVAPSGRVVASPGQAR